MKKIIVKDLLKFYGLQMIKSYFYVFSLLLFPFSIGMKIIADIREEYVYMDYASLLNGFVIPVQGMMLLVAVYMYRLVSEEVQYRQSILFPDIVTIQYQRIFSILLNHVIFVGTTLLIGLLGLFIYYQNQEIPWSTFQLDILEHAVIFYFLPLTLTALWGINCALIFGKRKTGMLALFLVWVLIGPLNTEFFSDYFYKGGFEGIRSLLFIGPIQPGHIHAQLSGFLGNEALFIKNILHISLQCVLLFLLVGQWHLRASKRILTVVFSILGLGVLVFVSPFALANNQLSFDRSFDSDLSKHYKPPYTFVPEKDALDYMIQKMNLNMVQETNALKVEADMLMKVSQKQSISLSLWHEYDVNAVIVNNRKVKFKRQGDFISFPISSDGSTTNVKVRYDIKNSPYFALTKDTWYLPATLNWYPVRQSQPINRLGVGTLDLIEDRQKMIDIKISGDIPKDITTNLKRKGERSLVGRVAGVTMMQGHLAVFEYKDHELVTDDSWSMPQTYWQSVQKTLEQTNAVVQQTFDKQTVIPKKVILVSPNEERNSYLDDAHLLLQIGTTLRLDQSLSEVVATYVPGILWSNSSSEVKVQPKWKVFNAAFSYWIQKELKLEPIEVDPFFLQQSNLDMKEVERWIKEFMDYDHKQQLILLKKWYSELNETEK